jgi:hypothetical protein
MEVRSWPRDRAAIALTRSRWRTVVLPCAATGGHAGPPATRQRHARPDNLVTHSLHAPITNVGPCAQTAILPPPVFICAPQLCTQSCTSEEYPVNGCGTINGYGVMRCIATCFPQRLCRQCLSRQCTSTVALESSPASRAAKL